MSRELRVQGPRTARPDATGSHTLTEVWGPSGGDLTTYHVARTGGRLRITDGRRIDLSVDVEFATALRDALTDLLENYDRTGSGGGQ